MTDGSKIIDDGGPAFPSPGYSDEGARRGMSLRDWFAGKIMAAFLSQSHAGPKDWTSMGHGWGEDCANELNRQQTIIVSTLASFSYAAADAMIAARRK